MDFLIELALIVVNSSIGKRSTSYVLHTKLGIPLTVEIVNLKTPLLLRFQLVEYVLQITAVRTVRSKVLDELESGLVIFDFLRKLLITDKVGVGHEPVLTRYNSNSPHEDSHRQH